MKKKPGEKREKSIPGKIDEFINEKKEEIDALKKFLETLEKDKEEKD